MDDGQRRFGIDELADLGGVSRRTVRYYVQEGLLPEPLGVGRGRHYDRRHLDALLRVKTGQEAGRSLDEIRACAHPRPAAGRRPASAGKPAAPVPRSVWRRLELAPGVELHLAHGIRMPAERRLDELAEWCRQHLVLTPEGEQ